MIKVEDGDDTGCFIEIFGNAEVIAQQFVFLTEYLNENHPAIFERATRFLEERNKK